MSCIRRPIVLVSLFLLFPPVLAAEGTRARLEAAIRFLADDLLEGRGTPSRGLDIAALYLANDLRASGWKPAVGEGFYQAYTVAEFVPGETRYRVTLNGKELKPEEFTLIPFGMDPEHTPVELELLFVGRGVVAPERGVDDLEDADVRGKALVSLLGAPWELDPNTPFGYDRAAGKSISATGRGAALLVYVSDELTQVTPPSAEITFFREMAHAPVAYIPAFEGRPSMGLGPMLALSPGVFDRTLAEAAGATYREWQDRLSRESVPPFPLEATVRIGIETTPRKGEARNVLAVLPGTDPALRDEWVILTAHYDHLGFRPVPEGEDGIWNGADDNASGTAAVLEIARRLASAPQPPRRSVLVFLTSGEDRGLLGSAYYSTDPVVPFDRVVVNVNVDMVGRSTGSVQAIAPGSEDLFQRTVELGARRGIRVEPDEQPSWRILYLIDSYHFARFEVPVIEFFTGLHEDYHRPSDIADRIHYEELAKILEVIADLTTYYVQGGNRPAFRRPEWFLTP